MHRRLFIAIATTRTAVGIATILSIALPIQINAQTPPKTPIVVIDPGHGGQDFGAWDGNKEKDAVLAIGLQTAKILDAHGVKTILTRDRDIFIPLDRRVQIAKETKADLFISIHANYFEKEEASGVETYYYGASSHPLATTIQTAIVNQLKPRDRQVKTARFLVLRKSPIPAVLVETGFISNKLESALLATPEYRNRMADAIARGILRYLNIQYKLVPAKI
jgi:N-acetylmuramoyl-L-alanine amidase